MRTQARAFIGTVVSSTKPKSPPPPDQRLKLRGWQAWLFRGVLALLAPLLILPLTEGTLRLFGYGYPVSFFVKADSKDRYITNQKYAWQFHMHATPLKPFLAWLPLRLKSCQLRVNQTHSQ